LLKIPNYINQEADLKHFKHSYFLEKHYNQGSINIQKSTEQNHAFNNKYIIILLVDV